MRRVGVSPHLCGNDARSPVVWVAKRAKLGRLRDPERQGKGGLGGGEVGEDEGAEYVDVRSVVSADPHDITGLEFATGRQLLLARGALRRLHLVALGRHHRVRNVALA